MKYFRLHTTNIEMPAVGLGTWQSTSDEMETSIVAAVESGYRHIDTAFNYNNEDAIGQILKKLFEAGKIKREELFVTTKLPHIGTRASDVEKFLRLSLQKLNLDYVDLYLVHVPFGFYYDEKTLTPIINEDGTYKLDCETNHIMLWQAMEDVMTKGLVKNIGLSNFNEIQVQNICENCQIKPQVLQIECHAYLQQEKLRKVCEKHDITVVAYSPLGSPNAHNHFLSKYNFKLENFSNILDNSVVKQMAIKYNKSEAQVLLRHLIQGNAAVIPKSTNSNRIAQNIDIFNFELTDEDMIALNKLDKGEIYRIIQFDVWKGVRNHPCYPF